MKKFLLKLLLLVLLPMGLLDVAYQARPERSRWYGPLAAELRDDETNIFLVGSSRTLAAVDAEQLTMALRAGPIPNARVHNLGGPYSTLAQHFLGLRNLAADRPAALRGSLWLLETLNGLPEYPATWTDAWANPDHKEMLLSVLRSQDLGAFWSSTGLEFFDKAYLSTALFSGLGRSFLDTRARLLTVGERGVDRWLKRFEAAPALAGAAGFAAGTAVREDEAGIQLARQLALEHAAAAKARAEVSYGDWERQIVRDWVREVGRSGGRAYFFDIPLSSVQAAAYVTPTRRQDGARLAELARGWGDVRVLPLTTVFRDEDFPDLIHLRQSRRAEFGAALVRSLVVSGGKP